MDKHDVIIGASIIVKGTTTGTITDFDGKFTLNNVPENSEIQISFIGYVTQTIKVGTQRSFQIILEEDSKTLDEVVVIGYGTQKKVNLTGAIGQVDSKALESRPIRSTSTALQGTIGNLQITPASGEPGAAVDLNIRGTTSINGGSPLVLVDGVEMNLDLVNPNDIENVTVLKDAAAAAIYGVRAAFGVILVTTKSGKVSDKTVINYSGNFSFSTPTVLPNMVKTSWEFAEFLNMAADNSGANREYSSDEIEKMKAYHRDPRNNPEYEVINDKFYFYGYTDWTDEMMKDWTFSQRHNVDISGGNEKTRFFSSIGLNKIGEIYKMGTNDYQRLNTRLSVENQTTPWMKLGAKVLYNYTSKDKPHKYKYDAFKQMVYSIPTKTSRPWSIDPRYPEYDQYEGLYFADQNPIAYMTQGGQDKQKQHDVWLTASADFDIMKGWKAKVDFTYNLRYDRDNEDAKSIQMLDYVKMLPTYGDTDPDYYKWTNKNKDYYSFNAYTEYENTFADKHYLKGMVGFNQELTKYQTFTAQRNNMLLPEIPSLTLGSGTETVTEDGYEWALRGGFFRLNYIYDNRYLVEVNGRYDGTSRFPKDNRFVFLPSFSGAWRISEEKFMESTRSWLDNLKFRISYGVLGNQLITDASWTGNTKYYPYIPMMGSEKRNDYIYWLFESSKLRPYLSQPNLVTPGLTWEKAATINGGIDITLFNQRLDIGFDYYERTTSDMLMKVSPPSVLGITAPPTNSAELKTKGWEITLKWKDRIGKDFQYDLGLVLSDAQATITKYDNPTGKIDDTYYVGQKIGEIWGYETQGFFQTEEDLELYADRQSSLGTGWGIGDVIYKDLDGSGKVNAGSGTIYDPGDRKVIGNTTPRYHYGITLNLSYKNLWANFFIQGVGKRDFWPEQDDFWPTKTAYYNVQKHFVTDSWSEDNRNAYFARPLLGTANDRNYKNKQSKYIQDASYMRMKNITIGYNLPLEWIKRLYLTRASVYVSGENLFEISHIKGAYDPEAARGNGTMLYPYNRTYSLGINLTF